MIFKSIIKKVGQEKIECSFIKYHCKIFYIDYNQILKKAKELNKTTAMDFIKSLRHCYYKELLLINKGVDF